MKGKIEMGTGRPVKVFFKLINPVNGAFIYIYIYIFFIKVLIDYVILF